MGFYIDKEMPTIGKAQALIAKGFTEIPRPTEFIPNVICVVSNGPFDAAGWCYSEEELRVFTYPDPRPKRWIQVTEEFLREEFGEELYGMILRGE